MDNRGFGGHKQILNQMRDGDERDKELMQVLTNVVQKETSKEDNIVGVDNGDENENEDDDDYDGYGDESEGEETSQEETTQEETTPEETTPQETKSDCSDTSAYASATDNITSTSPYDLSLSVESIEHQKGGKVKTDPGNFLLDKKPEEGKHVVDQEKGDATVSNEGKGQQKRDVTNESEEKRGCKCGRRNPTGGTEQKNRSTERVRPKRNVM